MLQWSGVATLVAGVTVMMLVSGRRTVKSNGTVTIGTAKVDPTVIHPYQAMLYPTYGSIMLLLLYYLFDKLSILFLGYLAFGLVAAIGKPVHTVDLP